MLDDVGLIHMNGRVYDPGIGRFVSADPNVPHPYNSQSYNRYSYVLNNPLSLVDPSGFVEQRASWDVSDACIKDRSKCKPKEKKEIEDCQRKYGPWACAVKNGKVVPLSSLSTEVKKELGKVGANKPVTVATNSNGEVEAVWYVDLDNGDAIGGLHFYVGLNEVCGLDKKCTAKEMKDYLPRFTVPGRDPSQPAQNLYKYWVFDPRYGFPAGRVFTEISQDGLTVSNTTLPLHVLFNGKIVRDAINVGGTWYIGTRGFGYNVLPGAAAINQWQGPMIFDYVDQQMAEYINEHR